MLVVLFASIYLSQSLARIYSQGRTDYPGIGPDQLAVDTEGRIWVANVEKPSKGKLDKLIHLRLFDDNTWRLYKQADSISIGNSFITGLAADRQGNVWIGTWKSGLVKFDGKNWTLYKQNNSQIAKNMIGDVFVDNLGRVWITYFYSPGGTPEAPSGVTMFDGTKWTTYTTNNSGLLSNEAHTIAFDSQNRAWIGVSGGISVFDGETWTSFSPANSGIKADKVSAIAFDENDRAWIGTYGETQGINLFDGEEWEFYTPNSMGFGSGCYSERAYSWARPNINIDQDGRVWVYGTCIRIFDGSSWISLPLEGYYSRSIPSVATDGQGRTWVGGTPQHPLFSLDPEYPLTLAWRTNWLRTFLSSGGVEYVAFVLACLFAAAIFEDLKITSLGLLSSVLITILFGPVIFYQEFYMNPGVYTTFGGAIGIFTGKKMAVHAKRPTRTRILSIIIGSLIGFLLGIILLAPMILMQ